MRSFLRPVAVIAFGISPALVISACGDAGGATSNTPLVPIEPTSYVVKEPASTTTTAVPGSAGEGTTSPVEQQYEVQAGDYLARIASLHGITVDELVAYNDWPEGINHSLFPGDVVLIPPGSQIPSATPEEEEEEPATEDTEGGETDTPSTDATTPSTDAAPTGTGDDCTPGSYTITAEDTTRLKVAEKFNVTVEALDAANANTDGYSAFYPGLKIVIPC